jgi:hypothetical protein
LGGVLGDAPHIISPANIAVRFRVFARADCRPLILHMRHNSFFSANTEIRKDFLAQAVDNQTTECVACLQLDPGTEIRSPGRGTGAAVRRCVQGGNHLTGERPAWGSGPITEPKGRRSYKSAIEDRGSVPIRSRAVTGRHSILTGIRPSGGQASGAYLAAG